MSVLFRSIVIDHTNPDSFSVAVKPMKLTDLPAGDVLIKVIYSSVNYKDRLACNPNGKIIKSFPFVPGIDLSGYVISSTDEIFREGQPVLVTGFELGVSHYGGYSEYARVPGEWVIPLPEGLDLREAMVYGTAGFTAALSIQRLEENGMSPDKGTVLVTGATGGVGSIAVAILSKKGYHVMASTGNLEATAYLESLGAAEVVSRDEIYGGDIIKTLDKQLWQAAVDPVGGNSLAAVLSKTAYMGSVAVSGLTGGTAIPTTVMPFILRGVNLLGIDSVFCPSDVRLHLWRRLGSDLKPSLLDSIVDREVSLAELPQTLSDIRLSEIRGRVIVRVS